MQSGSQALAAGTHSFPWRNGRGLLAGLPGSLYLQQFLASSPIKAGPVRHSRVVWVAVFVMQCKKVMSFCAKEVLQHAGCMLLYKMSLWVKD